MKFYAAVCSNGNVLRRYMPEPEARRYEELYNRIDGDLTVALVPEEVRPLNTGGGFSVVWIETDDDWRPGDELPDEYHQGSFAIEGVSYSVAHQIAEGINSYLRRCGMMGRWAFAVESSRVPATVEA